MALATHLRRLVLLACGAATTAAPPLGTGASSPPSVSAAFPLGTVQLDAFGGGIRVRVAPPGAPIVDAPIRALLPTPPAASLPAFASGAALTVGDLVATLGADGLVAFTRASTGAALLSGTAVTWSAPRNATRPLSVAARVAFAGLAPGERVYGLGEHPALGVGLRAFSSAWAEENNGVLTIPWYASSLGYGFLWNVPAYGTANVSEASTEWTAWATLNADFWVTASPAQSAAPLADVMRLYADAVGHAPVMPRSATGFWYSKNRLRNQTQLLGVAAGFAARNLPLSVIVIDYLSWDVLGDDALTAACWPDPAGMAATLHAMNVEVLVSMYPYQNEGSKRYAQFVPTLSAADATGAVDAYNGCLGGETLYDAFNPAARAAAWGAWMEGYGRFNLSWMWQDCSEPGRDATRNGRWRFAAGSDAEVGPAWTREHARMVADGAAAAGRAPSDFVTLTRAFYPGSGALGAALWSGDVEATFDSLRQQVAVAQQAAMSGVAVWASDTGGYKGGNATDPLWCELVTRWSQFSAFTPLFRFHGRRLGEDPPDDVCGPTHGVNEPWEYCADAYASIAPLLRVREALRPYVLATSGQAAATGLPMVRPLALAFPLDAESVDPAAEATFMFGDAYLVAPVTTAGARTARVWLPRVGPARAWVDFFDASRTWPGGGVTVDADAPYPAPDGRFPVFELKNT